MKDPLYSELRASFRNVPKSDYIIVVVHLHVSLGASNVHVKHGFGIRNDNSERFINFCNTNGFLTNADTGSLG